MLEALVPAMIEQKVTGDEARSAFRALVRRHGEPAPGPWEADGRPAPMRVVPAPETLAGLPGYAYHPLGLERRRADAIRFAASRATRVEECAAMPLADAYARLRALPLVGPWTAAEVGPAGARRPGRGERRRLPPRRGGLLGPCARGARHRRADAGAPRALRRASRARDPAHRGGRDPRPAPRSPDGAALDRRILRARRGDATGRSAVGIEPGAGHAGTMRRDRPALRDVVGALIGVGALATLVGLVGGCAGPAPSAPPAPASPSAEVAAPTQSTAEVRVFFVPGGADPCGTVAPVVRKVADPVTADVALRELLAGPTADEAAAGFTSIFGPADRRRAARLRRRRWGRARLVPRPAAGRAERVVVVRQRRAPGRPRRHPRPASGDPRRSLLIRRRRGRVLRVAADGAARLTWRQPD